MSSSRTKLYCLAVFVFGLGALAGADSQGPRIPPDESLTPAQYERIGFPPLAADWKAAERATARSILRGLVAENPEQLPRYASASSGTVFERLLVEEFERQDMFEDAIGSTPVGQLENMDDDELVDLIRSDSLEGIYGSNLEDGLLFDRELVQLASQKLEKLIAIRGELDMSIAEAKRHGLVGVDQEVLDSYDQVVLQLVSTIAALPLAEHFSPAARSDALLALEAKIPTVRALLGVEARETLRLVILESGLSPIHSSAE